MAQNVTIAGASFSDVPSITVPVTGGGTASFVDTTIASSAAAASDIASGKLAYVNGSLVTGTASGGGGLTLLATQSLYKPTATSDPQYLELEFANSNGRHGQMRVVW